MLHLLDIRKLFSILLFAMLSFDGLAQNALTGVVMDPETKEPLPGVIIFIPDLKKGASSDEDGKFLLEGLPKGRFLIEAKLIGYSTFVQNVLIEGTTELNVNLTSEVTELHEVVVTGISHSTELRRNPIPLTTINNQSLVENTSTNLIDNISKKPGISQISTGAAISKPVIRGLSYNRIITLNDGIRQEGQQWGDEHGIEIDEFSVDRVELIKGAGSLMYGSDGLGGVVNFLPPNPVADGSVVGKWMSNYQTNNGLIANSVYAAGNSKGVYWLSRISNKIAKAYQNKYDGRVLNSGFRELNANGTVGVNRKWGYTEFDLSSFNQTVGLVEGDRDADGKFVLEKNVNGIETEVTASRDDLNSYSLQIPNQSIQHFSFSNTSNFYLHDSRIQLNAGYQRNQRKEFGNVLAKNDAELFFDLHTVNYNLIYFFKSKSDWQFSSGTSGMFQQNRNRGEEFLIPEYQSFDWGVFGLTKRSFGKLDLAGGIRYDRRVLNISSLYLDAGGKPTNDSGTLKFKGSDLMFGNVSASAGATYEFSKKVIGKLNVSRGFRSPAISELSSNGRHEGSLRYEYGNVDLKAETSLQLDASLIVDTKHISAELSVFQNTIQSYIYTKKLLASDGVSDSIPDPTDPAPAYQYVQGRAQLRGGELTFDVHPHPLDWLHFENSFSVVIGENRTQSENDSAKYLPFIPAPRLQSELRANIKKIGGRIYNAFFKVELNHYWDQNKVLLDNGTERKTSSYTLLNAGMGTALKSKRGTELFSLYFTITNLFDKAYQNHLSRLRYAAENPATGKTGVFNMGRNFSFKVVVPVSFKKGRPN
jgi:iron complex outermembrane receptor protein